MREDFRRLCDGEPLAVELTAVLKRGDVNRLVQLLAADPGLVHSVIVEAKGGGRTLLHLFADWPGHNPIAPRSRRVLTAPSGRIDPCRIVVIRKIGEQSCFLLDPTRGAADVGFFGTLHCSGTHVPPSSGHRRGTIVVSQSRVQHAQCWLSYGRKGSAHRRSQKTQPPVESVSRSQRSDLLPLRSQRGHRTFVSLLKRLLLTLLAHSPLRSDQSGPGTPAV